MLQQNCQACVLSRLITRTTIPASNQKGSRLVPRSSHQLRALVQTLALVSFNIWHLCYPYSRSHVTKLPAFPQTPPISLSCQPRTRLARVQCDPLTVKDWLGAICGVPQSWHAQKTAVQPRHHLSRIYQCGDSLGSVPYEHNLLLVRSIENQATSMMPSNSWETSRFPCFSI